MKRTFSPDVLAANPDLAAKVNGSKAKTPGGLGHHGYVPDENAYRAAGLAAPYDARLLMRKAAIAAMGILRYHAKRGGILGEDAVRRALDGLDELVRWTR
jgi:hypothetical protein